MTYGCCHVNNHQLSRTTFGFVDDRCSCPPKPHHVNCDDVNHLALSIGDVCNLCHVNNIVALTLVVIGRFPMYRLNQ